MNGGFDPPRNPWHFIPPLPQPARVEPCMIVLDTADIPHGESTNFEVNVHYPFRPFRLVVDPVCAPFYNILAIRMGMRELLNASVAATLFPPLPAEYTSLDEEDRAKVDGYLNKLPFETVHAGQFMCVTVEHKVKCPWHSDCAQLGIMCSGQPFNGYFQGIRTFEV